MNCGEEQSTERMGDESIKRKIARTRFFGPERTEVRREASMALHFIVQKVNQMIEARWPAGNERDLLQLHIYNKLGWMYAKTTRNAHLELLNEAEGQLPVKRRTTFGEWQQSHQAERLLCPWCNHCYCGNEDLDNSELDSDEEDRPRRGPIKCGYDLTEARQLYCCECRNRFRAQTPPGVVHYDDFAFSAVAGRDGAESPTDMKEIPVMKNQRPGNPRNPVFHVRQPQPWRPPMPEQIWPNNDPPPFRHTRAAEAAAAATETETEAAQVEAQDVQDGKAKQEPEGGYVDSDDEAAAAQWSTESSTPPPPTSPTSTASQPPSPPPSPMPSPTPSPPTSPEAAPIDGTETPQLPPLIAAAIPNPEEHQTSDDDYS